MKKVVLLLAISALAVAGCQKKEEQKAAAPQGAPAQAPAPGTQGGDPHAGLKPQEIPAGAGHKGKVLSTKDAAGYTYLEVEENGQKLWVAVMQNKDVKVGDMVEFPDSPPMVNFQSKSLNRTFDKIIFAAGIRIVK